MIFARSSGILLHPTSLPSPHGIGDLGPEAYRFVDFLAEAGQSLWQILPLGPTGYGNSPYQCFSAFAGNPLLISLEQVAGDGWLRAADIEPSLPVGHGLDYAAVAAFKLARLERAFGAFRADGGAVRRQLAAFRRASRGWLPEYALFAAIKESEQGRPWFEWPPALRLRNRAALAAARRGLAERVAFHEFVQFLFFRQWGRIRDYAHSRAVRIVGDLPLYVAHDSAEAWAEPEIFQFDARKRPRRVAGVPPDYFCETGQLWGNPVYDWKRLEQTGFEWWVRRIRANLALCDFLRLDHFRGLAAYWAVPFGEKTAVRGRWRRGPGRALFDALRERLGPLPIIAEDLGVITPDVEALRDQCGFPGMKVLQFAFDSGEANEYLPHTFTSNCAVYTGTHDNDTTRGWFEAARPADRAQVLAYLDAQPEAVCRALVRAAWSSVAVLAVIPLQDVLELGSEARMNLPGSEGHNWQWRFGREDLTSELAAGLLSLTRLYGRRPRARSGKRGGA